MKKTGGYTARLFHLPPYPGSAIFCPSPQLCLYPSRKAPMRFTASVSISASGSITIRKWSGCCQSNPLPGTSRISVALRRSSANFLSSVMRNFFASSLGKCKMRCCSSQRTIRLFFEALLPPLPSAHISSLRAGPWRPVSPPHDRGLLLAFLSILFSLPPRSPPA